MASTMDSRIWQRLPQKLIDRILAFLSPAAFFRARSVCRRWYSLLFSDAFLDLQRRLSPRRHWFVFFQHEHPATSFVFSGEVAAARRYHPPRPALVFDHDEQLWRRISFAGVVPPGFYPAASSGGILCWVPDGGAAKALVLCNPISRLSVQLPAALRPRLFPAVGLAAGDTSVAVLLAGDDLISPFAVKNLTAEIFLTGAEAYMPAAPLPRLCNLQSGRMVFHGGKFFCMSFNPFAVLACNLAGGAAAWDKLQPPMKRFLRSPSILELGGAVVVAAAVEKSRLAVPRSIRLWALQSGGSGGGGAWTEVERMPAEVYEEFAAEEKGRGFEAFGSGEMMAVTIKGSAAVLVFELRRRRWRWLPPCPFAQGGDGLRGFVFEPRIATPALELLQGVPLSG